MTDDCWRMLVSQDRSQIWQVLRARNGLGLSKSAVDLVLRLTHPEPEQRLSVTGALRHCFFTAGAYSVVYGTNLVPPASGRYRAGNGYASALKGEGAGAGGGGSGMLLGGAGGVLDEEHQLAYSRFLHQKAILKERLREQRERLRRTTLPLPPRDSSERGFGSASSSRMPASGPSAEGAECGEQTTPSDASCAVGADAPEKEAANGGGAASPVALSAGGGKNGNATTTGPSSSEDERSTDASRTCTICSDSETERQQLLMKQLKSRGFTLQLGVGGGMGAAHGGTLYVSNNNNPTPTNGSSPSSSAHSSSSLYWASTAASPVASPDFACGSKLFKSEIEAHQSPLPLGGSARNHHPASPSCTPGCNGTQGPFRRSAGLAPCCGVKEGSGFSLLDAASAASRGGVGGARAATRGFLLSGRNPSFGLDARASAEEDRAAAAAAPIPRRASIATGTRRPSSQICVAKGGAGKAPAAATTTPPAAAAEEGAGPECEGSSAASVGGGGVRSALSSALRVGGGRLGRAFASRGSLWAPGSSGAGILSSRKQQQQPKA